MRNKLYVLLFIYLMFPSNYTHAADKFNTTTNANTIAPVKLFGIKYFYRWSQAGQFEFTPARQEDLTSWTDMLTVWSYSQATDGESLALIANEILSNYKNAHGNIIRTNSIPRTAESPAEHFIAVVLGNSQFLEFAGARFSLVGGRGVGIIYSHRIYGENAGSEMSQWMKYNGYLMERVIMEANVTEITSFLQK